VNDYGDWPAEHAALRKNAGVFDLSFRGRICLVGNDRARFLHGKVTNDVKKLAVGSGCYAALTTAKGRMESDLNIFCLPDELLLDFEPGLTGKISQRLEKFIIADDVQIVDAAPHYGLLSVQGPKAEAVVRAIGLFAEIPAKPFDSAKISDATLGEIYLANQPRLDGTPGRTGSSLPADGAHGVARPTNSGFDLFVPTHSLAAVADKLIAAAKQIGGRACGWQAFETARIEAGIPRFGVDMDETNLPLECGIENRAVSYNKGCYIGQEVINRIHSVGHVTRELRGLRLADDLQSLPEKHDKLFRDGKETGYVTSAVKSPVLKANIALGYIRREAGQIGAELTLRTATGESPAKIVELPFVR
jgi:folate-binding protein YgfZ